MLSLESRLPCTNNMPWQIQNACESVWLPQSTCTSGMNFNVKLAKRDFVPLARLREITSDLVGVFCQPSRMASCSIRAGERETVMARASFIFRGGDPP